MGMVAILFSCAEPFEQIANTLSTESPMWILVKIALAVSEKKTFKNKMTHCGGHLGFPIGTILAIFDLEAIRLLHYKFQLKLSNGSGA